MTDDLPSMFTFNENGSIGKICGMYFSIDNIEYDFMMTNAALTVHKKGLAWKGGGNYEALSKL